MNLDRILQPGTHIEVASSGQVGREVVWDARVYANRADSFLIAAPEYLDRTLIAPVGLEVTVWAGLDNARCCFESLVLREVNEEGNILLELQKPQKLTVSDRRNFVRMESHLPVGFGVIGPGETGRWKAVKLSARVNLADLSGVGLSFDYHQPLLPETQLVLELPLEMKNAAVTIRLLGTVVRNEAQGQYYRVGVRFDNASELQQDLIMKHLFHNMRKQFQIQREDW